jgi:hypothetical protein
MPMFPFSGMPITVDSMRTPSGSSIRISQTLRQPVEEPLIGRVPFLFITQVLDPWSQFAPQN